jgi:hypothetical protein
MKRTIHFKNGETKEVGQEVIEILAKKESFSNFETFGNDSGGIYLVINTQEINYID